MTESVFDVVIDNNGYSTTIRVVGSTSAVEDGNLSIFSRTDPDSAVATFSRHSWLYFTREN